MKQIEGGITAPKGFKAAGVEAGIKYENRKDMALILSEKPCVVAGTFTSNRVKAAPVKWDMEIVEKSPYAQAVVVNTGIANAGTGEEGMRICEETAAEAGRLLEIPKEAVLIGSTGVIGAQLPMDKIKAGVAKCVALADDSKEAGTNASIAIMTTDTVNKEIAVSVEIAGVTVTLGGMSKGSGMIHPNMCTMLGYVTTDAVIDHDTLTEMVKNDVVDTYNMISVDGDTSTNDTLLVMANGMAGNAPIKKGTKEYDTFYEALHFINETQAKRLAADGEGAMALIETSVFHADTKEDARILARSVISSSLTKAAIYGHDSNWGRILCALGYAGADFDPEHMAIYYGNAEGKAKAQAGDFSAGMLIYEDGVGAPYSEEAATKLLSETEVYIWVDLKMGDASATAWGCDLTYDYVKINADYRS
ncbi:MAG: bifunctional glutamate N-acetyltransferase/amino-acid acetyltransferase ArgJ [Lachnospiraceae bacterium]|nr:bifunctional glutamate N-acetyltransferase/amino-acid acetyltransferase ArgJ [Lachnospiraceae bacterium]